MGRLKATSASISGVKVADRTAIVGSNLIRVSSGISMEVFF